MKFERDEVIGSLLLEKSRLERELRTDDLTGLGNARSLKEHLKKRGTQNFGLLFIDIDHFKWVNEEHGHLAASKVLSDFGRKLSAFCQASECQAFRYAGDEFVVLGHDSHKAIDHLAESIRKLVETSIFAVDGLRGKTTIRLTVSIGSRLRTCGEPVQQILNDADRMLFEAKRKSRNTAVAYHA